MGATMRDSTSVLACWCADTFVRRLMAYGMAGLSVVADSLSAIKYAKVFPVYDETGLMVDFR
jgi:formate C-acetyltransferase